LEVLRDDMTLNLTLMLTLTLILTLTLTLTLTLIGGLRELVSMKR